MPFSDDTLKLLPGALWIIFGFLIFIFAHRGKGAARVVGRICHQEKKNCSRVWENRAAGLKWLSMFDMLSLY